MSWQALFRSRTASTDANAWLMSPSVRAHGLSRALGKQEVKELAPYCALQGAVGAALAIGRRQAALAVKLHPVKAIAQVVFPLVILDGNLLWYEVDASGIEKISHVDQVCVSIPTEGSVRNSAYVWVVTPDALGKSFLPSIEPIVTGLLPEIAGCARDVVTFIAPHPR